MTTPALEQHPLPAGSHPTGSWLDYRLRSLSTMLYAVAIMTALLGAKLLQLPEPANHSLLHVLAASGLLSATFQRFFPWHRFHRNFQLINTLGTILLVALLVANSGGVRSPFASYFFMITVFAALYYERTLAVTIGVIIAVVSLAPIFTTPPTGDGAHLLIEAPIHLGLAYIGQLMVGELIRHRRAHAELADELARASESQAIVIEAARTDPLTKLRNRSALNDEMQRLVEQHHTLGVPFSMLFLDIDHFKQINDRCGHICGDDILRQVAMLIRTQCRSTDVTARYGGEEFVMLLPGASGEVALKLGERVRAAVEQHRFWTPRSTTRLAITVSVGIAACPVNGTTADELLAHADAGMYSAKRAGRNQVRWPHDTQAPEHEASEMLQGVEA